jgi:peptide/nickel transport system substrate-binding protein
VIVTNDAAGTVTFRLTEPDPDLPYKLALPFAYPVPAGVTRLKEGKPLPATGPYVIAASSKRELRLERNPHFRAWSEAAKREGIPDAIVWRFGVSQAAQVAAVERGEADVALDGVPASLFERIATRFASQLHVNPERATLFVFLNMRVPPFDDVRVRRALNYALDRNAIVRAFGGPEQAQPTCQVLPPNLQGYRPYCPYSANPTPGGTWSAPDLPRAMRLIGASGTRGMRVSLWWTKAFPGFAAPSPIASLLRNLRLSGSSEDDRRPERLLPQDQRLTQSDPGRGQRVDR